MPCASPRVRCADTGGHLHVRLRQLLGLAAYLADDFGNTAQAAGRRRAAAGRQSKRAHRVAGSFVVLQVGFLIGGLDGG